MKNTLFALTAALLVVGLAPAATAQAADNGLTPTSDFAAASPVMLTAVDTEIGGPWLEFLFREAGTWAEPCGPCTPSSGGNSIFLEDEPPWTFFMPFGGGSLTVTDAFLYGDAFDVYDNSFPIGSTSYAEPPGSCGSDPAICFPDPASSSEVFPMAPGFHAIELLTWLSPFDGGAAYFRVDQNAFYIDMDIKFCSSPNAFNSMKKGAFPVTIFGAEDFDVTFIDRDTLQICMDPYGNSCTPAGLKSYSFYDRGEPGDAGTYMCYEDVANPDGYNDLDAGFYATDVAALIGPVAKGDVVGPLYVVGYLDDGTPFLSQASGNIGIDLLLIKK